MVCLLFIKAMIVPALFVNYELRKDFIIKNYCVNKDKPELHCDGQCYLAKQIKAAEQKDEKQATNTFVSKLFHTETSLSQTTFEFQHDIFIQVDKVLVSYIKFLPGTRSQVIFHPPQA